MESSGYERRTTLPMRLGSVGAENTPVTAYHTVVTTFTKLAGYAGEGREWWMLEKDEQSQWRILIDQIHEAHVCLTSLRDAEAALVWARVCAARGELDPVVIVGAIEDVMAMRPSSYVAPLYRGGSWTVR